MDYRKALNGCARTSPECRDEQPSLADEALAGARRCSVADPTGFMHFARADIEHREIEERLKDWREVDVPLAPTC